MAKGRGAREVRGADEGRGGEQGVAWKGSRKHPHRACVDAVWERCYGGGARACEGVRMGRAVREGPCGVVCGASECGGRAWKGEELPRTALPRGEGRDASQERGGVGEETARIVKKKKFNLGKCFGKSAKKSCAGMEELGNFDGCEQWPSGGGGV